MSRRIEVELTSARGDGTWTWRAAGAKQPKGVLDGALLPDGVDVGAVLRADVEADIEGLSVTAVHGGPARERKEPERLELLGPRRDEPLVTTHLAGRRGGRERGDRRGGRAGDRRDRRQRPRRGGPGDRTESDGRGNRAERGSDRRSGRRDGGATTGGGPDRSRQQRPAPPERPRPKRLRAGRANRKAVLDGLPPEQRPIAEQVLRGGIPAVRQAIEKQNEQAKAEGRPEVRPEPVIALAEELVPKLRGAEWRDRADAALAGVYEIDLRDLRSVVVAADDHARDDESRAVATKLREGLNHRLEQEQQQWLTDITELLAEGRTVRALRLSSRPPKAGVPLPPDLASRLVEATTAALTADVGQDRWAALLDALSFSPVRRQVQPAELPAEPNDELLSMVRKVAVRLPELASRFGVEPAPSAPRRKVRADRAPRAASGAKIPPPPPPPDST